jgi:UDP:flavonoid glycosyltransferase YjiC (YdhE family)
VRVTLVTFGSRGDAEPFVALGARLVRRGHEVRIVTHAMFAPLVEGTGVTAVGARGRSVQALMDDPEGRALLDGIRNPLRAVRRLASFLEPELALLYEDTLTGVRGADVVVCSPATMPGLDAAEREGVPVVQAQLQPLVPTGAFPAPVGWLGARTLGAWGNRASYALDEAVTALLLRRPVDRCRERVLGLGPRGLRATRSQRVPRTGALVAVSPRVVPRPPDWPERVRLCGWWWSPSGSPGALDPATEAFLAAGPAPVLVGLGSMPVRDPAATTAAIVGAARDAGVRLLLQRGWAGLGAGVEDGPDVHVLGDVPHEALLRRVRAVVHHGGAGTTGRGLTHGLPTLVLPVLADQFFWGHRLAALGVGPPALPLTRADRGTLAGRFRDLVGSTEAAERARRLGSALREEDGCGVAAAALEELSAGRPPRG